MLCLSVFHTLVHCTLAQPFDWCQTCLDDFLGKPRNTVGKKSLELIMQLSSEVISGNRLPPPGLKLNPHLPHTLSAFSSWQLNWFLFAIQSEGSVWKSEGLRIPRPRLSIAWEAGGFFAWTPQPPGNFSALSWALGFAFLVLCSDSQPTFSQHRLACHRACVTQKTKDVFREMEKLWLKTRHSQALVQSARKHLAGGLFMRRNITDKIETLI